MEPNLKSNTHTSQISLISSRGSTNANSPKMGSRRIFTPQFKLQVLESYRNDSDCKGNQRATARKYNIHRRQIQKWLQCESNLRYSVANINHNSVKHQFHNVSMQQQQPQKHLLSAKATTSTLYTSSQLSAHLCLDSTRPVASPNTKKVPLSSITSNQTHRILEASAVTSVSGTTEAIANTITSTLQPSAITNAERSTTATITPILHHHHYGIPSYNHVPTSVPILNQHLCQMQHIPHQPYLYHNMAYAPTFTHQTHLSTIDVLSTTPTSANSYTMKEHTNKVRTKTNSKFLIGENGYIKNQDSFEFSNSGVIPFSINHFKDNSYSMVFPFSPMDLSLRHRRIAKSELGTNTESNSHNTELKQAEMSINESWNGGIDVIDLTYRKRRVNNELNTADVYKNEFPEKQPKLLIQEKMLNESTINNTNCNDDDFEIEVGTEEKCPPSKPVKLFKPYLLDDCDSNNKSSSYNNNFTKNEQCETFKKSSNTSCETNNTSSHCNDAPVDLYHENAFPVTIQENILPCSDNYIFLEESRSESPRRSFSPDLSVPTLSPTNFQRSKGSPASSGYESSSSTYSESSSSSKSETFPCGQTYSINLHMQTIYNDNIVTRPTKQFQRCLDEDESKSLTTNSSIALLI